MVIGRGRWAAVGAALLVACSWEVPAPGEGAAQVVGGCVVGRSTENIFFSQYAPTVQPANLDFRGRIDTNTDARCVLAFAPTGAVCVMLFERFQIIAGQTVRAEGSRPLVLVTVNDLTIDGRLDVSGGPSRGPGSGSATESNGGSAGGGNAVNGGMAYPNQSPVPGRNFARSFRGGGNGGTGGGGGGAVLLASLCGRVTLSGLVDASGGNGAADAGGGAGGTVWLNARAITFGNPNVIDLTGGSGSGGYCSDMSVSSRVGTPGTRGMGGTGASCTSGAQGGNGGVGGASPNPPGDGSPGRGVPSYGAGYGGGGGSYGRLVIQGPSDQCAQVQSHGECVALPL